MKKLILVLSVGSLLALGSYADKKKETDPAKPAKTEKGDKAKKKAKGEEVAFAGDVKCAHCDFKIGDKCAAVLKTEKKFSGNESRLYFLKGKAAKKFAKENPKAEKVEASGLARKRKGDEHFDLKATKIAEKK